MAVVKILVVIGTITIVFLAYLFDKIFNHPPAVPNLEDDFWWGPGEVKKVDESIRPFRIQVSKEVIADLNERLDRYLKKNHTPPLENQGFQYGFNTDYLRTIIAYWRNIYRWKDREEKLNQYPQYKTNIQGLDIHFLRVPPTNSTGKKILPLLILHSWPGSVKEFYDIIPLLTTPKSDVEFVFEVIAPSLPGYGFSDGAGKPGLGVAQIAVVMNNLMKRIGFDKYYVQGGDWGSVLSRAMSLLYPSTILGAHSNMCCSHTPKSIFKWILGSFWPFNVVDGNMQHLIYPWARFKFFWAEFAYLHILATKPDTIGSALMDTPAGLAAVVLEKFALFTNLELKTLPDGGLTKKFKLDDLLDIVMINWVSDSIQTSGRLYAEVFSSSHFNLKLDQIPTKVPMGCARFQRDIVWHSEFLLRDTYLNLLHLSDYSNAGHFAAMEVPKVLSNDIWAAVKKFESYHKEKKIN